MRPGGSSFNDGQDAGNKAKMVRAFEEEEHKCPSEEVREVDNDRFEEGRGRSRKNWGDVITIDETSSTK